MTTEPRTWYEAQGLAFPPIPPDLESQLETRYDTVWSTGDSFDEMWDARGNAERVAASPFKPAALLGARGRGLASNGLYFYVITQSVALFLEHSWGNAGDDVDQMRTEIAVDYSIAERILEGAGQRSAGSPVVAVKSTVRYRAATHVNGEWQPHPTHDVLHRTLDYVRPGG